jgi:5'-methylthioadenosine phosphorylase
MAEEAIGIIGGTGLYDIEGFVEAERVKLTTPFGDPSDEFLVGDLEGKRLIFLPRHGRGHRILPHEINYRANIFGMKQLGAGWVISVSAVGSMKEEIKPGDLVLPDQFFDRTRSRPSTLYGGGAVVHVAMAEPVCPALSEVLYGTASEMNLPVHRGGTYICIDGPQFSTKGESRIYRRWGVDVIGMTAMPEGKLAREAELCYATISLVTDYDCWHETEEAVTVEGIMKILAEVGTRAKSLIRESVKRIGGPRECPCADALRDALLTPIEEIPEQHKVDLAPLIGRYVRSET